MELDETSKEVEVEIVEVIEESVEAKGVEVSEDADCQKIAGRDDNRQQRNVRTFGLDSKRMHHSFPKKTHKNFFFIKFCERAFFYLFLK